MSADELGPKRPSYRDSSGQGLHGTDVVDLGKLNDDFWSSVTI